MAMPGVAEQAVEAIETAVADEEWAEADKHVGSFSELLVGSLLEGDVSVSQVAAPRVRRVAGQLAARSQMPKEGHELAGQLRTLSGILVLSLRLHDRFRVAAANAVAIDDFGLRVLSALRQSDEPLINRDLSARTGIPEETMSRRLPDLLAHGLIHRRRVGKATENALTDKGRVLLDASAAAAAP